MYIVQYAFALHNKRLPEKVFFNDQHLKSDKLVTMGSWQNCDTIFLSLHNNIDNIKSKMTTFVFNEG